jgi:hypothetical protein
MVKIEFWTQLFQLGDIRERLDGIPLIEFIVSDAKSTQRGALPIEVVRGVVCTNEFTQCAKVEIYAHKASSSIIVAALDTCVGQRAIAETMTVSAIAASVDIGFAVSRDCDEAAA